MNNIPFSKKKQKEDGKVEGEQLPPIRLRRRQHEQGHCSLQDLH